jgi:hypothetical protein
MSGAQCSPNNRVVDCTKPSAVAIRVQAELACMWEGEIMRMLLAPDCQSSQVTQPLLLLPLLVCCCTGTRVLGVGDPV